MKSRWARQGVRYSVRAHRIVRQEPPAADGDFTHRLPRTPALSPATVLEELQVESGLKVKVVAGKPDIVDPIAMTSGEQGRVFVERAVFAML